MEKIILNKKAIGRRLKAFAQVEYGSIRELAKYIQFSEGALRSSYVNGISLPGPKLLILLHQAGCDIIWLLTGRKSGLSQKTK